MKVWSAGLFLHGVVNNTAKSSASFGYFLQQDPAHILIIVQDR